MAQTPPTKKRSRAKSRGHCRVRATLYVKMVQSGAINKVTRDEAETLVESGRALYCKREVAKKKEQRMRNRGEPFTPNLEPQDRGKGKHKVAGK